MGGCENLGFGDGHFWKENDIFVNRNMRIIDLNVQSGFQGNSNWFF